MIISKLKNKMLDLYESLKSFAKVNKEFADELDPDGYYWGQCLESSADQHLPAEFPTIDWSALCVDYLESCEDDDPCRQIDALNAILNASAEFDAKFLPESTKAEPFIEEAFLDWITGNNGPYSFLIESFYGDCEVESVKMRKDLLYKWMFASFEEGWKAANGNQ